MMAWIALWVGLSVLGVFMLGFIVLCVARPWDTHTLAWPPAPDYPPPRRKRPDPM
jgi:hypothetical protein